MRRDRKVLGQTNTLLEKGIDFGRLRQDRLAKIQREMAAREIGALLLTDIINIRYATGVSIMPLWTAVNLAHYVLVPVEGSPVIFEYGQAQFRVKQYWSEVRPAHYWQSRFADQFAGKLSDEWAAEIKDVLVGWDVADATVGIDTLDYNGFMALQKHGIRLTDADETMEAARIIKTMDEIDLLRQSVTIAEAALYDLEQAIRPGITENELLAIFWHKMLALGGEWCFTRLLASGYKTNPWFHEAGSKMVRPGDLVGIDTDMIGIEGYACDISRTFLCGERGSAVQREAYKVAHDFVQGAIELCTVGRAYEDFADSIPAVPEPYIAQRYPVVLHGIGTDDEPPFIPYPDRKDDVMPQGVFQENMVVSVEFYAGKVGEQDGVKLEDMVWITAEGPVLLSLYPFERKLM
ncbi:MAG: Xaa-Pro peptidase family protein [Candidatus Promineifilaceae bacterium]